jgi:hypothetical protein
MPYDPRPINNGGNRGIDTLFSRKAPKDKYRIIGVDTFDGMDWLEKDCDTLTEAQEYITAKVKNQQMLKMYIYDDAGKYINGAGIF